MSTRHLAKEGEPMKSWRNLWRRQTGINGFAVEWIVWCAMIAFALRVLTYVLRFTAYVIGRLA